MNSNSKLFICLFLLSLFVALPQLEASQDIVFPDPEITISLDLQDARLKDVLKILSIQSKMNFIASEAVQERKITLYLDKVPLEEAMSQIFWANNLSYHLNKDANIFIVKDWGPPRTETITRVFFLKNATVSTSSLKEEMSNKLKDDESSFGGSSSGGGAGSASSTSEEESGKWKQEEDAGITKIIKKLLSEFGSVLEDFRTNSLIVTDVPSRMEVIAKTIESLDVATPQVMLEVEMLDVSKNAVDEMGVNWPEMIAALTVPGSRETAFPFGDRMGTNGRSRSLDPEEGVFDGDLPYNWDFGAWGASHFGPSILTVIGATLTLDFLKTQTDTKYLARPRILTLNNEPAEIKITTMEAIGTEETVSGGGTSVSTSSTSAERFETGVKLRVTPQINAETGEITMFLTPSVTESIASNIGATLRDPETRSVKAVVRMKDGETVVLGGLIRNQTQEVVTKLPVLGDIPFIGAAFRHTSRTPNKERELLVFITPHIVKNKPVELAQAKKVMLPEREQGAQLGIDRSAVVGTSLDSIEKKKK
ncbi:MAG: hypothetical protein KBA46_03470 [Candidatus Omnitrophica bacterium]|nr:hypothetical protein [Candidatus Omnitrophota bacterium]